MDGPQVQLLGRLMQSSQLRAKVLANNLANANTPGFVRQTVSFEETLQDAITRGSQRDFDRAQPEIVDDLLSPPKPDGNNVTLELEMNSMRENRILYETYAAMLAGHFELMRAAVQDGN